MGYFVYSAEWPAWSENIAMKKNMHKETVLITWLVVILCLGIILVKGYFAFFIVGDSGMPTWDYQTVKDIPGESPEAIYEPLPNPQHVSGKQGK